MLNECLNMPQKLKPRAAKSKATDKIIDGSGTQALGQDESQPSIVYASKDGTKHYRTQSCDVFAFVISQAKKIHVSRLEGRLLRNHSEPASRWPPQR